MPSLQLDAPITYRPERKQALAEQIGRAYAEIMGVRPELVTVVIRDGGEGSVWRCTEAAPVPGALLMCDVRRGRSVATRATLARVLIAICAEHGDLDPTLIKVEFTQHDGDDMYHPHLGGFNQDWTGDETS